LSPASDLFAAVAEQDEAKALLRSALSEGPAHAYLFHGPSGIGKRKAALLFAGELLGDLRRVEQHSHPDLYLLEPVGDQIRIDDTRALRRDLHMRPFEAQWRVYLIFSAETMNREAADALLKDLEEPPAYAVFVLVASDPRRISATIRSRCQSVSFHRLSEQAVLERIERLGGVPDEERRRALARIAAGRLDRLERLLEPAASARRARLLAAARAVYNDPDFEPADAVRSLQEAIDECGAEARAKAERGLEGSELSKRDLDQRLRRVERGAKREELLAMLEELAAWYRDLVAIAVGAGDVLIHSDAAAELRADGTLDRLAAAEDAIDLVRGGFRCMQSLNLNTSLALEALFTRLHALFAGVEALV
jgi:DNA polymerase-3 subunit delta'